MPPRLIAQQGCVDGHDIWRIGFIQQYFGTQRRPFLKRLFRLFPLSNIQKKVLAKMIQTAGQLKLKIPVDMKLTM